MIVAKQLPEGLMEGEPTMPQSIVQPLRRWDPGKRPALPSRLQRFVTLCPGPGQLFPSLRVIRGEYRHF